MSEQRSESNAVAHAHAATPRPGARASNVQSLFSNLSSPLPDWAILLGALVLISIASVASLALQLNAPDGPPLSARAYGVTGGWALARWVETLGYPTRMVESRPYKIPDSVELLFMLQPSSVYALGESDTKELMRWVHSGGTLVVAVQSNVDYPITRRGAPQTSRGDFTALAAFGITATTSGKFSASNTPQTVDIVGQLDSDAVLSSFSIRGSNELEAPNDATVLATLDGRVVAVSRYQGDGRVIAFASPYAFSNEGLDEDNNARLVLSLLGTVAGGSTIGFDEYQHGSRQATSITSWLVSAPAGQGTLLALLLLAAYILWTGRRLGRIFVPPELRIRRIPSEYVVAMANLARAAGQQNATLQRYNHSLKQRLGKPYRIDPILPDDVFVAELAQSDAGVDGKRLLALLTSLSRGTRSRTEFVRLARDAAEYA